MGKKNILILITLIVTLVFSFASPALANETEPDYWDVVDESPADEIVDNSGTPQSGARQTADQDVVNLIDDLEDADVIDMPEAVENEPAAEVEAEAESAAEQGAENPAPEFEASVTVPQAQASRSIMPIIIAAAVVVIAVVLVLVLTKGRKGRHS